MKQTHIEKYRLFYEKFVTLKDPIEKILKLASRWEIEEIYEYIITSQLQAFFPPIDEESELNFVKLVEKIKLMAEENKLTCEEKNKLLTGIDL